MFILTVDLIIKQSLTLQGVNMIAFQKYLQVHQTKMLFVSTILAMMVFFHFLIGVITIAKKGMAEAITDPVAMSGLIEFPVSFLLILILHKLFNLYIKGEFFTRHTLMVLQTIAKLAIFFGLVLNPAIELSLHFFYAETKMSILHYFSSCNFPVAIVGYVLHIGTAAHKISREIEQEQELTV